MGSQAAAAELPDTGESATLNQDLLAQYKQRRSGLFERLINAYLEEAPQFLKKIREGAEGNVFADVKLNAHALKSCSYNLGAVRLSKICQSIENAAVAEDSTQVSDLFEKMGPEFFEVEEALKTELLMAKRRAEEAAASA